MLMRKSKCSPAALGPKPGPRQIAPKKNTLVKQQKMTRVRPLHLSSIVYSMRVIIKGGSEWS